MWHLRFKQTLDISDHPSDHTVTKSWFDQRCCFRWVTIQYQGNPRAATRTSQGTATQVNLCESHEYLLITIEQINFITFHHYPLARRWRHCFLKKGFPRNPFPSRPQSQRLENHDLPYRWPAGYDAEIHREVGAKREKRVVRWKMWWCHVMSKSQVIFGSLVVL